MNDNEDLKLDLSHLSIICEFKYCGEDINNLIKEWEADNIVFSERLKTWIIDLESENPKIQYVIETINWTKNLLE